MEMDSKGHGEPTCSCAIGCLRPRCRRKTWSDVSVSVGLMRQGGRCGCDIEGPGDDEMRGLPRLSPHQRLCGRLRP